MWFFRVLGCAAVFGMSLLPAHGQDCFSVNTTSSYVIYTSGQEVVLPVEGGKLLMLCTQRIRNLAFGISFASGGEHYFEESTQFVGVLSYGSSTFILQYDKGENTFRMASDQQLGEGAYTLTLSSIMCTPHGSLCSNCFVQYSFFVEYINDPDLSVEIEPEPDPAVLTCLPGSKVLLKGSPLPHNGFQAQWARLVGTQFVNIPGATATNYTATVSGTYLYIINGPAGCKATNLISVKPPERPVIQVAEPQQKMNSCAQPLTGITVDDSGTPNNLLFNWAASQGGVIISGSSNTLSPVIGTPGVYTLVAQRIDNGCADTAAVNVVAGNIPVVQVAIESVSGADVLDCKNTFLTLRANASLSIGSSAYSFQWSNGATSEEILITQPSIYAVTVTALDNSCLGYADRAIFQNIQPPVATLTSSRDTVCAGESVVLSATSPEPATFRWPDGTLGSLFTVTPSMDGLNKYTVTVTANANGCSAVFERVISRLAYPPLTCLPTELTLYHGGRGTLNCTTAPTAQLFWSATSTNVSNIPPTGFGPVQGLFFELSSVRAPGRVVFVVFARQGTCNSAPAQVTVQVLPPNTNEGLYIPEVITPDGDGLGDIWEIVLPPDAAAPSAYELLVYNRLGALVWQNTLATPFAADRYPDGVYFYVLNTPEGIPIRGTVSILRRK